MNQNILGPDTGFSAERNIGQIGQQPSGAQLDGEGVRSASRPNHPHHDDDSGEWPTDALRVASQPEAIQNGPKPPVLWIADGEGKITCINPNCLCHVNEREGAQLAVDRELHPDDIARWLECWQSAHDQRKEFHLEVRFRQPNGRYRWFAVQATPIAGTADSSPAWFGVSTDIHDHKMLESQFRETDRQKDELLAMLGHEMRNPLTPICSGLEILIHETNGHNDVLRLMQEQVEHLERLADDVSDVSRILLNRMELCRERIELSAICERSVAAVSTRLKQQEQELQLELPDEEIWLDADPVRLVQVIENLINNASTYSDRGSPIQLQISTEGNRAVIAVRDHGIGITPDLLPTVFDLFTRGSRSRDRSRLGLGIGLSLVRTLTEMHGGEVSVASAGAGRGSEFSIHLPFTGSMKKVEQPPKPAAIRPTDKHRILIVDDNVEVALMLGKLLSVAYGHEIQTANDGPTALEVVSRFHPRIILLDIELPGMSGYDVAKALRTSEKFDHVLVVALTGYGQPEERLRTKAAGFDAHLVKPLCDQDIQQILIHPKLSMPPPTDSEEVCPADWKHNRKMPPSDEQGVDSIRNMLHELGNLSVGLQLAAQLLDFNDNDVSTAKRMLLDSVTNLNRLTERCRNPSILSND